MHSYWKEDRREKYKEECKSERAERLKQFSGTRRMLTVEEFAPDFECVSRKLQKAVPSKAELAQWEIQARKKCVLHKTQGGRRS